MTVRCFVEGCPNRYEYTGYNTNTVKKRFFRFPSPRSSGRVIILEKEKKLKAWLRVFNLQNATPEFLTKLNKNARVCSRHFISGEPSNNPNDPDWVPSLNLCTKQKLKKLSIVRRTMKIQFNMNSVIPSASKRFCSVPKCSTYGNQGHSFHSFPLADIELCKRWKDACKIQKPITGYMTVCDKHFVKDNYIRLTEFTRSKRIKKGAIPSQNLPTGYVEQRKPKEKSKKVQNVELEEDEETKSIPEEWSHIDFDHDYYGLSNVLDEPNDTATSTAASGSYLIVKSADEQPETHVNFYNYNTGTISSVSIQSNHPEESETILPDDGPSPSNTALLKENHILKEEIQRLTSVVETLKAELLACKQKEIKLEQMVRAVKDIVNEDIQLEQPELHIKEEFD